MISTITKIKECVDCGLPCLGSSCPYQNMLLMECDECGQQTDELYGYGSKQLCSECVLNHFDRIDPDEYLKNQD